MNTNDQQGIVLNVVVGIAGATLAGWFISPLIGVGTINQDDFSLPALLVSYAGAAILLGIANLFRRGTRAERRAPRSLSAPSRSSP